MNDFEGVLVDMFAFRVVVMIFFIYGITYCLIYYIRIDTIYRVIT